MALKCVLIERKINAVDNWRASTYKRPDGSTFHVAIPPYGLIDPYSKCHAGYAWDEAAEAHMILQLVGQAERPEEN